MRRAAGLALAALLLCAVPAARAQLIDRVDVARVGADSEIRIRFAGTVQYLRHSPPRQGTLLRIELRSATPESPGARTVLDQRRIPGSAALPGVTVTYPMEDGSLGVQFERAVSFRIRPGPDPRSLYLYVPVPPAVLQAEAARAEAGAPPEIETQAAALMAAARASLAKGDVQAAVETLNRLLNLPPNKQSQAAQELIGEVRERNGELAKARAEYELYLRLYPTGEGAERVRKRLAALPSVPVAVPGRGPRRPEHTELSVSGAFSQFYYRGATKFDATLAPPQPGLQLDRVTLTAVDQSSLVNSLDLTTRVRAPEYDGKLVVRDIYTANFLEGQGDVNRLYAAYYEHQTADGVWLARAGRQLGTSSGLLGRFDGLWAGYRFLPGLRLNLVGGQPVEFFPAARKSLYGANLDILPEGSAWNANLYYIEQTTDGFIDRRAVGSELRYFDARRSGFALVDYDTEFRKLDTLLLQGNVIANGGTSYTAMLDHRRVPSLQLTNSLPGAMSLLPGATYPRVADVVAQGVAVETLREWALALTPVSDLLLLGVTGPVTRKLQLGADFRLSRVSGTRAAGDLPETPGTGNVYVYTGQAIKTALLGETDTGVASASVIDGRDYNGLSFALSHVILYERWRTEGAVRYYRQKNNMDVRLVRWSPSLRTLYRWREHLSFELELGWERTTNEGPQQSDVTTRKYFSLGYRWDFF